MGDCFTKQMQNDNRIQIENFAGNLLQSDSNNAYKPINAFQQKCWLLSKIKIWHAWMNMFPSSSTLPNVMQIRSAAATPCGGFHHIFCAIRKITINMKRVFIYIAMYLLMYITNSIPNT